MPVLHYGHDQIEITDADVDALKRNGETLSDAGFISLNLDTGWIHLVTGPGIPIWIDQREPKQFNPPQRIR